MCRKFCYIISFLLLLNGAAAQGNLTDLDYKVFRFGFSLGTNLMHLDINHTELVQDGKIYYADVSQLMPGFTVGLVNDLRLHRYFNLRVTPALLFGQRNLRFKTYDVSSGVMEDDKVVSLFSLPVDIPVILRYSAERYGNFKPYIQAGVGTTFDLGRDEQRDVNVNVADVYVSAGIGCDLYFKYFKLSPELKLNVGQSNIHAPKIQTEDTSMNLKYSNAIASILSRILVFSLNVE